MKSNLSRRDFIKAGAAILFTHKTKPSLYVITVNGRMPA
jgi:hypothetical protein